MPQTDRTPSQILDALLGFHREELRSFAQPGGWMTGEERTAVVRHARRTRADAGLQDWNTADDDAPAASLLPDPLLTLVERIAISPFDLDRACFEAALEGGVSDAEYVETVGLVSRCVNVDVFARGLGRPVRALLEPEDGEPSLERPAAIAEGAWPPTLPCGPAGGEDALALYGKGPQPFIYRALSLVPAEASRIMAGGNLQYLTLDRFFDFAYSPYPSLSRPQVEAIAGRVSALNGCFY